MTSTLSSPDQATTRPVDLPDNAGRAAMGIAIVLSAQLMFILDATVVNVALPKIDADLGFGPASLSWVLSGYTLAFGGLLLLGGRLGDVFGRLRLFLGRRGLHARLSARWARADAGAAGCRARAAGCRRRHGRARRTRAAHHQRSRRAGPQPGARALRRGLVRRHVPRPAARWRGHRPRLVALDAVHQRAHRAGDPRDDAAVRRRDPAPPRPVRRGRRVQRHRWRGRARLDPDRRARARLDLGAYRSSASSSAPPCWRCWRSPSAGSRTRCCGPPCCAAGAGSAAWPRSAWSSAASCRCSSSPCSSSRASSASGRWLPGWRSCRSPSASSRCPG